MSLHHNAPLLPHELEREIFEIAALLRPKSAPKLLLVARRVLAWVDPLLYRVLILDRKGPSIFLLRSKSAQFLRDNVQHLFFDGVPAGEIEQILSFCTGIRSLALMASATSFLPAISALRPARLAVNLPELFGDLPSVDFTLPIFIAITHLDIFDYVYSNDFPMPDLALLPALTHLALSAETALDYMIQILSDHEKLKVFISMQSDAEFFEEPDFIEDMRFVSMHLSNTEYKLDWETGVNGGMDFWARADKFVAMKRRGEIKPSSRYWIVPEDAI
ncbi:hypothetical protein B0H11DRAFT_395057 [Mycena galericulata]|nr:hypothetical protein B0H11DRAFT_440895 [Mycena galericulata]KAJ7446003.1 hypothetical protein B0H11DRAFT_395057 [Mycena galericulata]